MSGVPACCCDIKERPNCNKSDLFNAITCQSRDFLFFLFFSDITLKKILFFPLKFQYFSSLFHSPFEFARFWLKSRGNEKLWLSAYSVRMIAVLSHSLWEQEHYTAENPPVRIDLMLENQSRWVAVLGEESDMKENSGRGFRKQQPLKELMHVRIDGGLPQRLYLSYCKSTSRGDVLLHFSGASKRSAERESKRLFQHKNTRDQSRILVLCRLEQLHVINYIFKFNVIRQHSCYEDIQQQKLWFMQMKRILYL